MNVYRVTDTDIRHMLRANLMEEHKKEYFVDTVNAMGMNLFELLHVALVSYSSKYQPLGEAPLSSTQHNCIYNNFHDFFRRVDNSLEDDEQLPIFYVDHVDSAINYGSSTYEGFVPATEAFSPYMYDDIYSMVEESLGYSNLDDYRMYARGDIEASAYYPTGMTMDCDIAERMEIVVEMVGFIARELESKFLPSYTPAQSNWGVPVGFVATTDALLIAVER